MKKFLTAFLLCSLVGWAIYAGQQIQDVTLLGTANQVKSGAVLAINGTEQIPAVPSGHILYASDSSGTVSSLSVGTGLSIASSTLNGNTGTVTSVSVSMPAIFSVSGNPVTTSGTITATFTSQSDNLFFSGPSSGSSAAPTFRAIANADMPAAGPSTAIQYNSSGLFAGSSSLEYSGGTVVSSQSSSGVFSFFSGTNSNNGAGDVLSTTNDASNTMWVGIYGSAAGSGLANYSVVAGNNKGIIVGSDMASASGGSDVIRFNVGGYNTSSEVARMTSAGLTFNSGMAPSITTGTNLKGGTFTLNSGTPVVVSNTSVTIHSVIQMSPKAGSISGTITSAPFITAASAGTGFTVNGSAGDSSVYNYWIEENN